MRQRALAAGPRGEPLHVLIGTTALTTGDASAGVLAVQFPLPPSLACRVLSAGVGAAAAAADIKPNTVWFTGETLAGEEMYFVPIGGRYSTTISNTGAQFLLTAQFEFPAHIAVPDEAGTDPFVEVSCANVATTSVVFNLVALLWDPQDFRQGFRPGPAYFLP
jgi:hypothetical protein